MDCIQPDRAGREKKSVRACQTVNRLIERSAAIMEILGQGGSILAECHAPLRDIGVGIYCTRTIFY